MMREAILVVDDEALVLRIVASILAAAGFEVLAAASPQEALELAGGHQERLELLLADVVMPGMNGPELADAVAELHPEAEHLFMAGLPDSPEVCERILNRGRAFLAKPFTPQTLLAKVDEVLGRRAVAAGA